MIHYLLILFAASGTLVGVMASSPQAIVCGTAIFLVHCSALVSERSRLSMSLRKWLGPWDSIGTAPALPDLVERLKYRISIDNNFSANAEPPPTLKPLSEGMGGGCLQMRVPPRCATFLVARSQLIDGRREVRFEGQGSKGSKFERKLAVLLSPFLERGEHLAFGLRDESLKESLLDGFTEFGIGHSAIFPIIGRCGEEVVREVLWCGYAENARPSEREVSSLHSLAASLAREVSSRKEIFELSKRAADAESQNREKADFFAQMSHDMRSPLYNVKSILSVLELEDPRPEHLELLEVARSNCSTLEELVEDVLDLTRHRAGRLTTQPEIFNLTHCVRQVTETFAIAARLKSIELLFVPSQSECLVEVDRKQIKRVAANLIGNAIKYTQRGKVRVEVAADQAGNWKLEVADSGCGMSELELRQLFTPFARFSAHGGDGLGLGLVITKILVELNGGSIYIESKPTHGSKFTVRLPRSNTRRCDAIGAAERPNQSVQSATSFAASVLLVDDDAGCVDSLSRLLQADGWRVLRAYSTRDALSLINFEIPNFIITDGQMPDGGARRLLRTLRERHLDIPLLVLSGAACAERVEEFLGEGARKVLLKPAEQSEIFSWLREMIADEKIIPAAEMIGARFA